MNYSKTFLLVCYFICMIGVGAIQVIILLACEAFGRHFTFVNSAIYGIIFYTLVVSACGAYCYLTWRQLPETPVFLRLIFSSSISLFAVAVSTGCFITIALDIFGG
jgi:hypothetical protein